MGTVETLQTDVTGLMAEAKRSGKAAVHRKIGEAMARDPTIGPDVAPAVIDAIRIEGEKLIETMMPSYRGANRSDRGGTAAAQAVLRGALDGYLSAAVEWGRTDSAFEGKRDALLDTDYDPVCEQLREKLYVATNAADRGGRDRPAGGSRALVVVIVIVVLAAIAAAVVWAIQH